jgi:hypothetical protein
MSFVFVPGVEQRRESVREARREAQREAQRAATVGAARRRSPPGEA